MTTEATARRQTQKLQRAIVDGLEDVKAQDLKVFNTEHLSALFERVIIASGTSNRQTKALANSVREAVREAGFPKPRIEGEANGEWIIVDCGRAVVHVMQPAIRSYYNLEEIWGDTPVRLKLGAAQGPARNFEKKAAETPVKSSRIATKTEATAAPRARRAAPGKTADTPAKRAPRAAAGGAAKSVATKGGARGTAKVAASGPAKGAAKRTATAAAKRPATAAPRTARQPLAVVKRGARRP
ncbi:MAG: ribosome silencing factor [Proteobacteria bacterium]|nr:ribosome silencing factor [Pseudomonadota bacterium]